MVFLSGESLTPKMLPLSANLDFQEKEREKRKKKMD